MATTLFKALDNRISELESQISALKAARTVLAGKSPTVRADGRRGRTFTAAQRAEISRRMKATWTKRRKAAN
jgi:hypothetical protein